MHIERADVRECIAFADVCAGDFFILKDGEVVYRKTERNIYYGRNDGPIVVAMSMDSGEMMVDCFRDHEQVCVLKFKLVEVKE